jgi:hypothetical protein
MRKLQKTQTLHAMRLVTTLSLLLVALSAYAQNVTVSGYLLSQKGGEAIPSGSLLLDQVPKTKSNAYGYFSFAAPPGRYALRVEAPGYLTYTLALNLRRDTTLRLEVSPWEVQLNEVRVTTPLSDERGNFRLTAEQIKSIPTLLAEPDVLKVLQLMPGVQGGAEGTAGIHVRGGSPDQTLILMDGVPVYNVNHLFGFFSVFNPDAVAAVELYKNELPARYGGRLSSVVDITMREGNRREAKQNFQLGPLSSKLLLEGPIKKDTSSYLISVRRTWLDVLAGAAQRLAGGYFVRIGFYDLNAKVNFQPNRRNRFFLSFYSGNDGYKNGGTSGSERSQYSFRWGNLTGVARWNHVFGPRLFKNTTLSVTDYRFQISNSLRTNADNYLFRTTSKISDLGYKSDFVYSLNRSELQFGTALTLHRFAPGIVQQKGDAVDDGPPPPPPTYVTDLQFYADYAYRPHEKVRVQAGLHHNMLHVQTKIYHGLQPRVSLLLGPWRVGGFRASFVQSMQFLHLLTNASLGLPTDLWVPITDRIPPQRARQYSAGVYGKLGTLLDWSVDVYTKTMRNQLEYTEGASFLGNPDLRWYDRVTVGNGRSRGLEMMVQKQGSTFNGFVSYTLSRTSRTFAELNGGRTFPYRYDRRHVLNVSAQYILNSRRSLQLLFAANSGGYVTVPTQRFDAAPLPVYLQQPQQPGSPLYYLHQIGAFPERNNLKMPFYHRLDLSYKTSREKKKGLRTWTFAVYNAYNQQNAFFLFVNEGQLKKFTLFPVLPSLSYEFRFR